MGSTRQGSEKALIIGGTRGLGYCLAELLFERGIVSVLVGRPRADAEPLMLGRGSVRRTVQPLRMTFATPIGAADLIRRAADGHPDRLTHLIYAAGQHGVSPLRTQPSKTIRDLVDGGLNGLIYILQALLAARSPDLPLRITLIAGPATNIIGRQPVFDAVKAAQVELLRSLFPTLPDGSTVLIVHPDPMDTAFWEGSGVNTKGFVAPGPVASQVWGELEAQRKGRVPAFHQVHIHAEDPGRERLDIRILEVTRTRGRHGLTSG